MVKSFAPRVSKQKRKIIDLSDRISEDILKKRDLNTLLQNVEPREISLEEIIVTKQVRTKFNDRSLEKLASNIRENGLIQPLVIHRQGAKYTLVCGERRFRAMNSLGMKSAPCFVLEGKSDQELMSIQFSENSSREDLHYIDKSDGILNYQQTTGASERKITIALGISKSEVHRSLIIGKMQENIKEAAKIHNIEKYVLLEFNALVAGPLKDMLEEKILEGNLRRRSEIKKLIREYKAPSLYSSKQEVSSSSMHH